MYCSSEICTGLAWVRLGVGVGLAGPLRTWGVPSNKTMVGAGRLGVAVGSGVGEALQAAMPSVRAEARSRRKRCAWFTPACLASDKQQEKERLLDHVFWAFGNFHMAGEVCFLKLRGGRQAGGPGLLRSGKLI